MKRILTIALITMTIATIALAQQPRRMGPHGGPGGPNGGPPPRELAEFLGLTSDQQTQIDALHQSLRATIDPLMEQKRAADEQLRALVDVANPDPTAVGKQFLAMHAIDEQIKAAHDATEQKVAALLTADQRVKFEAFNAARHMAGPPPPPR